MKALRTGIPSLSRTALLVLLAAALVAAAAWGVRLRRVTRPSFPTRTVETSLYVASYPAHWEPVDVSDPRLGEKEVTFINHRGPAPELERWDRPRWRMTLRDEGAAHASPEALAEVLRKQEERPEPLSSLRLGELRAFTWVERSSGADLPYAIRWYVFASPGGRPFLAGHDVPADRTTRLRYEHIFRGILSSLRFK